MGCGSGKVLPEQPKHCCMHFVKSVVTRSCKRKEFEEEPPRPSQKSGPSRTPHPGSSDGQRKDKLAKYRAKFDPRVTARYDIRALIGHGSYSRVVRVEHRGTRQPFAIKMVETASREGREACEAELSVLRRVSHAHVVRLVEVFQSPGQVCLVLELATGGELFDRVVARGSFTERDAARALRMALEGVAYLHSLGIVHRDLKPENLLYYHPGPDARLLVTDFGLAGSTNGAGAEDWPLRTTCGTPEYLAPEVLRRGAYSSGVDMWALGIIAYILLSGSMPFEGDSRPRLYRAILKGRYSFSGDPWPCVSGLAKDLVERLLTVDPAGRLTAARALSHPWVVTMAAGASMTNLQHSISQNLQHCASSRNSARDPARCSARDSAHLWERERLERGLEGAQPRITHPPAPLRQDLEPHSQIHTHSLPQTHSHPQTHGLPQTHGHSQTHPHPQTHSYSPTHSQSQTHRHSHTHGQSQTHSHPQTHGHSQAYGHSQTYPHPQTHSQSQTNAHP